jgi:rubrerythrin
MRTPQNVYRRFVQFEEEAAEIYLKLASRFSPENPELSFLWLELAMGEKEHAGLLQFCLAEKMFAERLVNGGHIRRISTLLHNLDRRAANPELSMDEAFVIAAEMEGCEVNDLWRHLTSPVHSSLYLLRKKIASTEPDHVARLLAAARRFRVSHKTLRLLERLAVQRHVA